MQEITTLKFYEEHSTRDHINIASTKRRMKWLRDNKIQYGFGYVKDYKRWVLTGQYDAWITSVITSKIGKTRKFKEARDQFYKIFGVDCWTKIKKPKSATKRFVLMNEFAKLILKNYDLKWMLFGHRSPYNYLSGMGGWKYGIVSIGL